MSKDILGEVVRKIVDLPVKKLGVICDLVEKMAGAEREIWFVELKKLLRKEKCWLDVVVESPLKLISGDWEIVVDKTSGKDVLSDANDVFSFIDGDFRNWLADGPGVSKEETPAAVYEIFKPGYFVEILNYLSPNIIKLSWEQSQIKAFVKKHSHWLAGDDGLTLFLFQSYENFFIANVGMGSDGKLKIRPHKLGIYLNCNLEHRYRLVVPELS